MKLPLVEAHLIFFSTKAIVADKIDEVLAGAETKIRENKKGMGLRLMSINFLPFLNGADKTLLKMRFQCLELVLERR